MKQTANYYISDIGRRNGDSNYQAMFNRQIETIVDPLSILGGALSGAALGNMAAPGAGAAIGLVVGAAGSNLARL